MRIDVTDIKDGHVLKEDIFNSYNLHILSKNMPISTKEVSKLLQHHIEYIFVQDIHLFSVHSIY